MVYAMCVEHMAADRRREFDRMLAGTDAVDVNGWAVAAGAEVRRGR